MSVDEYMRRMIELGYPKPSLNLWLRDDGAISGCASYRGTCGFGGDERAVYASWPDLIAALFDPRDAQRSGRKFIRL